MAYRLFQNSDKTQPITEAGVSVGYSERKQGTVDALQATTLSKPLLGRWPKGGVRNLAMGAQAVSNTAYWPDSAGSGVSRDVVGFGVEDGVPFIDYRLHGIPIGSVIVLYNVQNSSVPLVIGESFVARVEGRVLAGTPPTANGARISVREGTSQGTGTISTTNGNPMTSGSYVISKVTREATGEGATNWIYVTVSVSMEIGVPVDVTYRFKGLQFERGDVQTPLQFNYGPNNITEPGVEDEWFLYNDGNDSLNTQPLQSGDFSVTSVDIYGNMDNKPIVNSSGGSINSLVKERQRDVIVRSPPLIPSELEQVQAYWKAKGYKTEWSPLLLMSTQTDGHWSRGYNPNID